jgi:hypothetical protein
MKFKIISILLLLVFLLQAVVFAQDAKVKKVDKPIPPTTTTDKKTKPQNPKEKWFWPIVSASGALFVTSIVLFVKSEQYESKAQYELNQKQKDSYSVTANILSSVGIGALSGSVAGGLYALKMKYEPDVTPLTGMPHSGCWYVLACRTFEF